MSKQTVVQKILEQMNLKSNIEFQSWMLNNSDELLEMENNQMKEMYLKGIVNYDPTFKGGEDAV